MPTKARVLLAVLSILAVMMLGAVVLTLVVALKATAHPATGVPQF